MSALREKKTIRLVCSIVGFVLAIGLLFLISYFAFPEAIGRLTYELDQPYTADNALYFAVGKGLASGLKPYADLYENKPPMIFAISALSWILTGDFYLVSILCVVSFLLLFLVPLFFIFYRGYKKGQSIVTTFLVAASLLGPILLLAFYSEKRSGESQVEIFGAACSLVCLLFLYLAKEKENIKFYHPYLILAGLFFSFSLLFKEPFGALLIVLMLVFLQKKKDLLHLFLIPLIYAFIFFCIILLSCNCFDSYFTIYLKNMLTNHISIYGSPFERMLQTDELVEDLRTFSPCLPLLLLLVFTMDLFFTAMSFWKEDWKGKLLAIKDVLLLVAGFYAASFMVGLGGQYYNHHFVFAVPYYVFLLLYFVDRFPQTQTVSSLKNSLVFNTMKKEESMALTLFTMCCALGLSSTSIYSITKNSTTYRYDATISKTEVMKEDANYIDAVLDALGEERYLYLGFNGFRPYAYTKHNPIGPSFAQDSNNFQDTESFFVQSFLKQLDEANVIVYNNLNVGVVNSDTNTYLYKNFTLEEPEEVQSIEKCEHFKTSLPITSDQYLIYYRTSVFFA